MKSEFDVKTAEKIIHNLKIYLKADEEDIPVKFRPLKKAPSSSDWPSFPGKKSAPGRPSVNEIPLSQSEALKESVSLLMEAHRKAEEISAQIAEAKRRIAEEFGGADQSAKREVSELATKTWRVLEKNRGIIESSDEIFTRVYNYIVGARGARKIISPPTPMPQDPRVDAAIKFVAEKVPALVAEFMSILEQIEKDYLLAQTEESRTTTLPPELAVYDLEAKASARYAGLRSTAGVLDAIYNWVRKVYTKLVSFWNKLNRFNVEFENLIG